MGDDNRCAACVGFGDWSLGRVSDLEGPPMEDFLGMLEGFLRALDYYVPRYMPMVLGGN